MAAATGGKVNIHSMSWILIDVETLRFHLVSYAGSDGTTRDESQVQKKMQGVTYDSYGKETYGEVLGNTNKGSSYWISPEGQKFTLTWAADEAGFQPKGDHLPVAPVHVYELPVAPVHEYELPVAPALPYKRTGLGY
jgi:hypothetical protein